MFTLQASQILGSLVGKVPQELIDALQALLGNCAAPLEHRGPIKFDPPPPEIEIHNHFNAVQGAVYWAKARFNWVNLPGNDSYVDCYLCLDRRGKATLPTNVRVYLPRQSAINETKKSGQDPNVVADAVILFAYDANGEAVCISDYLDDKIGTIKAWDRPDDEIPPGWKLLTSINGTSLWDPVAKYPRLLLPYLDPTVFIGADYVPFQTAGNTFGTRDHTHADHHIPSDNLITSSDGGFFGYTDYTVLYISGETGCARSNVYAHLPRHRHFYEITGFSIVQAYPGRPGNQIGVLTGPSGPIPICPGDLRTDPACLVTTTLTIPIYEPVCYFYGPYEVLGHKHPVSIDIGAHNHSFSIPPHSHTVNTVGKILQHDRRDHLDPSIVTKWIIRYDNSHTAA